MKRQLRCELKTIEGVQTERAERDSFLSKCSEQSSKVAYLEKVYAQNKKETEKASADVKAINSRVGKPCSECGKPYREEDIEGAKKIAIEKAKTAITLAKKSKVELQHSIKRRDELESALRAFESGMTDVTDCFAEKGKREAEIREYKDEIKQAEDSINELGEELKQMELKRETTASATNPHEKGLIVLVEKEIELMQNLSELVSKAARCRLDASILKDVVEVFGRKGVRAHLLESVTPYLNERTDYYLNTLSDGTISAIWTTLAIKSDGDLAEKFNIDVTKTDGADSYGGLSGGEKRKVRLSTAMALQDLVASRATKPIGIFIADEIDDALDDSGLERLMSILEEKGRERGTLILISHNDIGDWVRNVTKVIKDDRGTSSIVGHLSSV
ncbi:hypothetical protein THIOSC15_670006 [uncultured Thiomicrorhabdus sp.]